MASAMRTVVGTCEQIRRALENIRREAAEPHADAIDFDRLASAVDDLTVTVGQLAKHLDALDLGGR